MITHSTYLFRKSNILCTVPILLSLIDRAKAVCIISLWVILIIKRFQVHNDQHSVNNLIEIDISTNFLAACY